MDLFEAKKITIPRLTPVKSSNVAKIGYNPKEKQLFIQFRNRAIYVYFGVDMDTWRLFSVSPSYGKAVWSMIRDVYDYMRLK